MAKDPQPTVQWRVLQEEDDWQAASGADPFPPLPQPTGEDPRARLDSPLWIAGLALLLVAGLGGLWLWQQAQRGLTRAEEELADVAALENWAEADGRDALRVALLDSAADPSWREQLPRAQLPLLAALADAPETASGAAAIEIEFLDLRGELALAQVAVRDERLPLAYRETRFYRDTGEGWLRTAPDPAFFGESERLESEAFVFVFSARDRAAVEAIAPRLEALHNRIQTALYAPTRTDTPRRRIEIQPSTRPQAEGDRRQPGAAIAVPSPSLLLHPLDLSEEELLYEYIAVELIHRATWERSRSLSRPWRSARRGLRLWLLWELDGSLAQWRQETVHWLYRLRADRPVRAMADTPPSYAALCQTFWAWQLRPYYVGIPLTCDQGEHLLFKPIRMATKLRQLAIPNTDYWEELVPDSSRYPPGSPVAAATLFDYVASQYGRESIPLLLAGTDEHFRWEGLVPAVFGVPLAEFETEWLAHIDRLATPPTNE